MRSRYDTIIVGARCAGASTAMLLARAGLKVIAIDREAEGSDTLSTHALMRAGVLQLHRWGVLAGIEAAGTPAIRITTFHYGDEAIEIEIRPRDGIDALYAPRRTVLDTLLVEAARAAGAEVVHRVDALELLRDGRGRVRGVVLESRDGHRFPVHADLVIGADGLRSRLARLVDAEVESSGRNSAGVIYGYYEGLQPNGSHWHYVPGASVGVIPTNHGLTCVFAAVPGHRFRAHVREGLDVLHRQIMMETLPALALEGARRVGKLRPFAGLPGFLRRSHGPGWALVGDAGFFRDPITAHGITDALRDAELLARAVVRGSDKDMADYRRVRDQVARGMLEISDRIASFAWDLEQAKVLHLALSRQMNAEVELVRSFGAPPPAFNAPVLRPACPMSWPSAAV